jgi:hypothetical protein
MAWADVRFRLFGRNTQTGAPEQIDKSNDARNAMLVDTGLTGLAAEATQQRRLGGGKTPVPFTVEQAAAPYERQPAQGRAIRLYWITASADPAQGIFPRITISLGDLECYRVRGAVAHWEVFEGAVDAPLTVSISADAMVDGTAHIEEFTP